MIIRKYEKGDITRIIVKDRQFQEWLGSKDYDDALLNAYAFTAVHDGEIIAMAGFFPKYQGIGDVWALFSERTGEFKFTIVKQLRRHIELLKGCGFHYFMTPVKMSEPEAIKFIEAVGFTKCGELYKYLWDEDYYLYCLGGK